MIVVVVVMNGFDFVSELQENKITKIDRYVN
jgi:hypothetical protein